MKIERETELESALKDNFHKQEEAVNFKVCGLETTDMVSPDGRRCKVLKSRVVEAQKAGYWSLTVK